MKTIFIPCYNTFISRNIIASDVVDILKADDARRVVVFVPQYKRDFFEKTYGAPNVIFEGLDLDPVYATRRQKRWYRTAFLFQNSQFVKDKRGEQLYRTRTIKGYLNYAFVSAIALLLSNMPFLRGLYRRLDFQNNRTSVFDAYFARYTPDLIFAPDVFAEADVLLMREAQHRNIPVIAMQRSWDNTTTKGILRIFPNQILVNSPILKEELIRLHSYPAEQVEVEGLPQFDQWPTGITLSRDEFFRQIGADPKKRLIMFAPAGSYLSDTDWQICDILKKAMDDGRLPNDLQFLVRNHPQHPADFSAFGSDQRFIFETPGKLLGVNDFKFVEYQPQEHAHLMHSVYYCDIIMYIATSLGLDAQVFNKPQIIVAFDGYETKPYLRSVVRFNSEDCIQSIVVTGGVRVVHTASELVADVNRYLADPSLDQTGRDRIVQSHLFRVDGLSGRRIIDHLIAQLS